MPRFRVRVAPKFRHLFVALCAIVPLACGGAPASPTAPPAPRAAFEARVTLVVQPISLSDRASPGSEHTYYFCRRLQNLGPGAATLSLVEMTVFGPSGDVLVTGTPFVPDRQLAVGDEVLGCGAQLRDSDASHPLGVRYRVKFRLVYDDGTSVALIGDSQGHPPAAAGARLAFAPPTV